MRPSGRRGGRRPSTGEGVWVSRADRRGSSTRSAGRGRTSLLVELAGRNMKNLRSRVRVAPRRNMRDGRLAAPRATWKIVRPSADHTGASTLSIRSGRSAAARRSSIRRNRAGTRSGRPRRRAGSRRRRPSRWRPTGISLPAGQLAQVEHDLLGTSSESRLRAWVGYCRPARSGRSRREPRSGRASRGRSPRSGPASPRSGSPPAVRAAGRRRRCRHSPLRGI